ncbi:putative flavin-containing monooxygenase 1 [Carex rostrata]
MGKKLVGIIGAGVSGLSACKQALDGGFKPVVFESTTDIGGVWAHTPASTKLQSSSDSYQFSDFPWPENVMEPHPNNFQVMNYLRSYVDRFGLRQCIKFEHRVVSIKYVGSTEEEMAVWEYWAKNGEAFGCGQGKWHITVEHQKKIETYEMDFVILAIGRFSGTPNIPTFPEGQGTDVFGGMVIHAMDYSNMDNAEAKEFIRDKLVTVVGFQKSAVDIANECSIVNGSRFPCTMVVRTKHWIIPEIYPWIGFLYLNRLSEFLVHKPGEGFLLWLLATVLAPLRWLLRWMFSKFCGCYYKSVIPMEEHEMVPDYSFFQAVASCLITILPENFYNKVNEGSIILKQARAFRFFQDGVILEGENLPVRSDIVIFATGYRGDLKLRGIFTSPFFQDAMAGPESSIVPLYRQCIHPRIPQLAIIGYSQSVSNLFTSELTSKWLIHFLQGQFELPSISSMENDVLELERFMRRYSGDYFHQSCINALHMWFNDQLCNDMGHNPRRREGFFANWLLPHLPEDYADITTFME